MAVFAIATQVVAQEQSQGDPPDGDTEKLFDSVPDLADITPLSTELSARLAVLESEVVYLSHDVSEFEKKYAVIEKNLRRPYDQFQKIKDTKDFSYKRLVDLSRAIKREHKLFDEISSPLRKNIRIIGAWRKE